MDIQVSGKNMELGESLKTHVGARLEEGVSKYFGRGADAVVTFTRERHLVECEMTAHLDSGVFLNAHGESQDAYSAFDAALERLEKRVRRYKRRLRDHHGGNGKTAPLPAEPAAYYTLAAPSEDGEEGAAQAAGELHPIVIAEGQTQLREMTVGAAVMQLDLADTPVVVFRNAANGRLSIVYRRRDGHIGWIDPMG